MSFDSLAFLIFLPAVVLLHALLPQRFRWILLLAASIFFYASWNLPLTLLLLGVIALSFGAGLLLSRTEKPATRKAILIASLVLSLGLLLYFKYFGFFAGVLERVLRIFDGSVQFRLWDIILPVGLSFYTFQAMSYVIDVYRKKLPAETHPGFYALYIAFFPQLVAGPIERAENLLPQLKSGSKPSREDVRSGLLLLLSGFFRKVVIADLCGRFADAAYRQALPDGSAVFLGTLLFAFQIYCDFSGYSEIARGSARLLGIRIMQNFDRPYLSLGIREFWRRWHISLGKWFTDYVYIPLGGNRRGLPVQIFATLLVFLLSGLWHGAGLTFVVWGLFHGLLAAAEIILWRKKKEPESRIVRILLTGLTFLLVTFSWIFFRSGSLSQAFLMIRQLFSPWNLAAGLQSLELGLQEALLLIAALLPLPVLARTAREEKLPGITVIWLIVAVLAAWVIRYQTGADNAFIYFQF